MEFYKLKKYIQLRNSYSYELDLLCRYSHQNFRFRFLKFNNENLWERKVEKLARILLRVILSWRCYSKYYIAFLTFLFMMVVAFTPTPYILLGAIAFVILLIYVPVLMINEEVKRYEILNIFFESQDKKNVDENCFKYIHPYDDVSKLKIMIEILKGIDSLGTQELQVYMEKMGLVLEYTANRMSGYDVIKTYIKQGEKLLLIK